MTRRFAKSTGFNFKPVVTYSHLGKTNSVLHSIVNRLPCDNLLPFKDNAIQNNVSPNIFRDNVNA